MKKTLFLFLFFPIVSFASFPIKNDTIKKETVDSIIKGSTNKWKLMIITGRLKKSNLL